MKTSSRRAYHRRWYLAHREEKLRKNKIWRKSNPEKTLKSSVAWRKANHEAYRKVANKAEKAWRRNNPDKVRNKNRKRKASVRCSSGRFTEDQWLCLKAAYGDVCLCCGRKEEELNSLGLELVPDHVQALADHGSNDISNIQPLCHGKGGCNNRKGSKFIDYREQRAAI